MTNDTDQAAAPSRRLGLNPFQPLTTGAEALNAARAGGLVVIFLVISYVVQIALVSSSGKDAFGNAGGGVIVVGVVAVLLAGWLGYRIWFRQGLWSAILLAVWYAVETVGKVDAVARGQQQTNGGYIVMFAALAISAIFCVRGAWKLRSLRKAAVSQPSS